MNKISNTILENSKSIIFLTLLLSLIPLIYINAFIEDSFRSEAKILIKSESSAKLSGNLNGLAAIAGINLNSGGDSAKYAIEMIQSRDFLVKYVRALGYTEEVYAAEKVSESGIDIIYDEKMFDSVNQKWLTNKKTGKSYSPSDLQLFNSINKNYQFNRDNESGTILISYEHVSPEFAKSFLENLVKTINSELRQKDSEKYKSSIRYLQEKVRLTQVEEIKNNFLDMMQEQTKNLMLAEINEDYIFVTVDSAYVPEKPFKPKKILLSMVVAVLMLILSVCIILIINFRKLVK
jgi:uncharacterized protein involved in exopolysaccharide biosynthesis